MTFDNDTSDVIVGDSPRGCVGWVLHIWGSPNQPLPRAETSVDLHVKCRLLSDFKHISNVLINCSKTPQYQIS
jgi:hypothetical protein